MKTQPFVPIATLLVLFGLIETCTGARLRAAAASRTMQQHRHLAVASIKGDDGSPSDAYPLQKCQADCDSSGISPYTQNGN